MNQRDAMRTRLTLWTMLLLGVAAVGMLLPAAIQAEPVHTSGRIAFYPDLADFISPSTQAAVRPELVLLTQDGSVVVRRVRWRSWGGKVAHGRGTYTASNCIPSCAQGHLTNHSAGVTLSRPGLVLGHRVYRCFRLTVASHRKSDQHECLRREGNLFAYGPVRA